MTPEQAAAIAAANAAEVGRARRVAEENGKPGFLGSLGDTSVQLDTLEQAAGLAGEVGGFLWNQTCALGRGVGAVCDAVDSVLPKLD